VSWIFNPIQLLGAVRSLIIPVGKKRVLHHDTTRHDTWRTDGRDAAQPSLMALSRR